MLNEKNKLDRMGLFTASSIHKIMGVKGLGETGLTYIKTKVAEALGVREDEVFGKAINWGNENEDEAKEYYSIASKTEIITPDFTVASWNKDFGCTPDGLIKGQKKGIEIKCPYVPANHIDNLLIRSQNDLKTIRKEYYWQIVACMAVMDYDKWDFVSYDPRFTGSNRMISVEIIRDINDEDLLKSRIIEASAIKQDILNRLNL
jgi:hypothetical protein